MGSETIDDTATVNSVPYDLDATVITTAPGSGTDDRGASCDSTTNLQNALEGLDDRAIAFSTHGNPYNFASIGDPDLLLTLYDAANANVTDFGEPSAFITVSPCYCPGTLILTDRGQVLVETLEPGDWVVTASYERRAIKWVGRRAFAGRFLAGQAHLLPICISAGALGGGLPRRDLRISPRHALFLQGMLVPAGLLVNGLNVVQEWECEQVEYIHIELGTHDVILAEGAPAETFIGDHTRGMFHNAAQYDRLYPNEPRRDALHCAPRLESGERLQHLRQQIAQRAA